MENENKNREEHKITKLITCIYLLLACLAYFILGSMIPNGHGWSIGWIVFLGLAIVPTLCEAIIQKNMEIFAFPIVVVAIYLLIGLIGNVNGMNLWHPWWAIFFSIPLYYGIGMLVNKLSGKKNDNDE